MASRSTKADEVSTRTIRDAVCTACGCLCDDIGLTIQGDRHLVELQGACFRGTLAFLTGSRWPEILETEVGKSAAIPGPMVEGRVTSESEGVEAAARLLTHAKRPLITGLRSSTIEAQKAAVALADRLGATIEPEATAAERAWRSAVERVGHIGATLGEVRSRADTLVCWNVDPRWHHPRFFERYWGPRSSSITRRVLRYEGSPAGEPWPTEHRILLGLLALVRGESLDPTQLGDCGVNPAALETWARRMMAGAYVAWLVGPTDNVARNETLLRLIRELNGPGRRCVLMELGDGGNATGASAVLAWQTGLTGVVDFGAGFPQRRSGDGPAWARVANGEHDAVLVVGPVRAPSAPASGDRVLPPTIQTGWDRRWFLAPNPSVVLPTAINGLEASGRVMRADGVMLAVRSLWESHWPTEERWLRMLHERVEDLLGEQGR